MCLEEVGVEINHRGQIKVDDSFQTAQPNIYAVGDVIGFPGLASASYDQGRFAGTRIVDGESEWDLIRDMPTGIFTSPEISSVGQDRARADRSEDTLRSGTRDVSQYRPGSNNRAHGRHGQVAVPH